MPDAEKVVKGLRCIATMDKCKEDCPYREFKEDCDTALTLDALLVIRDLRNDAELVRNCREGRVKKFVGQGVVILNYDWWREMLGKRGEFSPVPTDEDLAETEAPHGKDPV